MDKTATERSRMQADIAKHLSGMQAQAQRNQQQSGDAEEE